MLKLLTIDAPSYWASALINGDDSGLEATEIAELEAWLKLQGLRDCPCVDCDDESHFAVFWFEVQGRNLGSDLIEYTFDVSHVN